MRLFVLRSGNLKFWLRFTIVLGMTFRCVAGRADDVSVLTAHNDNYRTGANLNEARLTTETVGGDQFGKLFTLTVDGCVYAQPLVISGIPKPGGGSRNLLIIATEHNSVYAFDADDHSGSNVKPIWQRSFIDPKHGVVPVKSRDFDVRLPFGILVAHRRYKDITPEIGITGTPVIDRDSGTIYLVASTREPKGYVHRLYALDAASGSDRLAPVTIEGKVKGVGDGTRGGMVPFQPRQQLQRSGLLLNRECYTLRSALITTCRSVT